jgi:c-di-GMP-binding flagellar brake protein YcgR
MNESRTKIVSDFEIEQNAVSVKKPFKLIKDKKRRYIRLEIDEPVLFSILKDQSGGYWPDGNGPEINGSILNISAGGILAVSESAVEEGSIIIINLTLQNIEVIDHVIGLVKRAVSDQGEYLIGVEFITTEYLIDYMSQAEIDVLAQRVTSFDEKLRKVLNKYVFYKRIEKTAE